MDWFIICSFLYCVATILEFAGVHYFTKVGSGERFGSETEGGVDESDPFSDEDHEDDNDGDDEWEDVEEWQHVNSNHRMVTSQQRYMMTEHDIMDDDIHDSLDRQRTLSGDIMNNLGPVIDPLNHNCISVYNKRNLFIAWMKIFYLSMSYKQDPYLTDVKSFKTI